MGEYERLKESYRLSQATFIAHKRVPNIMHPLPRIDELSTDLDDLPEGKYFQQAKNGIFTRAALMKRVLAL